MESARQLCTFYLDGLLYGIDVVRVQEVICSQQMTHVPLAPPDVRGLINLRGQIVTAVDMRRRVGLADRADDALPMNVVIRTPDGAASLLVDAVGDVMEVSDASRDVAPNTVPTGLRAVLRGIYKLDRQLLIELDTDKLVGGGPSLDN
jgi:purine-binding chemotaxis protein CheW